MKLIVIILLGILVIGLITSGTSSNVEPALTPQEKAAKAAEHAKWVEDVLAVRALRRSMKNPDSFKLEEALKMDDGSLCLSYRATNSFNAVIPGQAIIWANGVATSDQGRLFIRRWSEQCANKAGRDITYIRRAL